MRSYRFLQQFLLILGIFGLFVAGPGLATPATQDEPKLKKETSPDTGRTRLAEQVRKELVTLPYFGVFDNLEFSINGSEVTLAGQVTRPTLKSDAEARVQEIEGVTAVHNRIEVLPLSSFDDQIRRAVYYSLFSQPGLDRYAVRAVPSIHIIVKAGHVTLEGVVANEGDRNRAGIIANSVPNVFSVTNNLRLEAG